MTAGRSTPRLTRTALVALAAALLLSLGAAPAAGQESTAPATTLSNGGRTVSDGMRSLSISQATDLDPSGQTISVSGAGYPMEKGIYVAFCVIPPTNLPPTPCGGGRGDESSSSGDSLWVSSNPPVYAEGMTTPYGPGGTFAGTMSLSPDIADGVDCRQVRCAVVSRADHTRSSDRSLDLFVPVTFGEAASGATTPTTAPPPAPTVPTTVPVLQPSQVAPVATVAADSRSVSDGTRTLRSSRVTDLDPDGAEVTVEGSGYDAAHGIFVALCALPSPDPALPPGASPAPGPCTAGAEGAATWVSSHPPDYGADLAVPYGDGGSFRTELTLRAVIDAEHDCREVGCALVTRNDDTNATDRTQDLYLPVAFASEPAAADVDAASASRPASERDDGGGGGSAAVVAAAAVVVLGTSTALIRRRRRAVA